MQSSASLKGIVLQNQNNLLHLSHISITKKRGISLFFIHKPKYENIILL